MSTSSSGIKNDQDMKIHQGLPVHGYRDQSDRAVRLVNANKTVEENLLRLLDGMAALSDDDDIDKRWLAIGRTLIEQAFMAINRSIFRPGRVKLAGDEKGPSPHGHKGEPTT